MICNCPITSNRCQDLIAFLETMRLPVKSGENTVKKEGDEKKEGAENISAKPKSLNDPSIYGAQVPFLLYDENKETIISRTVKGINEGLLNPYEINWMDVTLYEAEFTKQLLEGIDSSFLKDVAQAIDDEERRHAREDGQFTIISSGYFGTGQGAPNFYSYSKDNWDNNEEDVSAVVLAENILDRRHKAEEYNRKLQLRSNNPDPEDDKVSLNSLRRVIRRENFRNDTIQQIRKANQDSDEIERLKLECEEWKAKYEEAVAKEPEKAFNPQTGQPCFTSKQMGIFLTAVGRITEKDNPPGKTTLGEVLCNIAGYMPSSAKTNMKGIISKADIEAVANAIENKFPNLAREVRKV